VGGTGGPGVELYRCIVHAAANSSIRNVRLGRGEIGFVSNDVQSSISKMLVIIDRKLLTVEKRKEKERKKTKKISEQTRITVKVCSPVR